MTQTLRLDARDPDALDRAAELLRAGRLVAFPTETVYGLGASALLAEAVAGIFAAKERPAWDPLIVHVAASAQVAQVAAVPDGLTGRVEALAGRFWPGPMTLLLPRVAAVPDAVTAGRPLVGVRVPGHPVARELLRRAGVPVAAPSANRFGHVSPTTADHVLADLDGRIDAVLDGGACGVGVESTVLDPATEPMTVYRAGAVTLEQLRGATGERAQLYIARPAEGGLEALPSPGVGIRHYAPAVPVQLSGATEEALQRDVRRVLDAGERVGVLLPLGWSAGDARCECVPWGVWEDAASLATGLFAGLRTLETTGVTAIVCPLPAPGGLGDALRDRLLKAARPR